MGYHMKKIEKGEIGEASKIFEEVAEFQDAIEQNNKIMALVELSDLYGAIDLYLSCHYPELKMDDLKIMSNATMRAFMDGSRK